VYDYTHNLSQLQVLAHDTKHATHDGHKGLTLGLTRYQPFMELKVPVMTVKYSNGDGCVHVDRVDVLLGYKDVTVYIPHEIPQGSCGFDEVVAHEKKHIAVNQRVLDEYVPQIEEKMRDYISRSGVRHQRNTDQALAALNQNLASILDEFATTMFTENARRQRLVDSPEEYLRVSSSCNGQLVIVSDQFKRKEQRP
jgi:hypothetical protein